MKRAVLAVSIVLLLAFSGRAGTLGDIDGDQAVGIRDAVYGLQAAAGIRPSALAMDIAEYMPMTVGNTWIYDDGEMTVSSQDGTVHRILDTGRCEGNNTLNFVLDELGFRIDGSSNVAFSPSMRLTVKHPEPGDRLASNITVTSEGISVSILSRVVGLEDVTVPAGRFDQCLKISLDAYVGEDNDHYHKTHLWFAKGIGIVKMQRYEVRPADSQGCILSQNERKLIYAVIDGRVVSDYYPLSVGNKWVYTSFIAGQNRVDRVIGAEEIDGKVCYVRERIEPPPDNYHETFWLHEADAATYLLRISSNEGLESPVDVPAGWVFDKADVRVGEVYEHTITVMDGQFTVTTTIESLSDAITVNGRSFSYCFRSKVVEAFVSPQGNEYKYKHEWRAPGVGIVRIVKYTDASMTAIEWAEELTSAWVSGAQVVE
jgi:hypothetical protein